MKNKSNRVSRLIYAIILTAVYVVLNMMMMNRHEGGSAEALIYLTNLRLTDLTDLTGVGAANLAGNGFPVLTSLLLTPLKAAGIGFASAGILSMVFMAAAVFIFILCAPFHMVVGIIVAISPVTGYFLGAQLTPFAIAVFLIVTLAALYPVRRRLWLLYMLLVALLFQTHINLWGFAAALTFTDLAINIMVGNRNPDMRSFGGKLKTFVPFLLPMTSMGFSIYLLSNSTLTLSFRGVRHFLRSVVRVALTLVGQACGLGTMIQWLLIICLIFALIHVFFTVRMPWQGFILCFGILAQGLTSYMVGSIPVQSGMVSFFMTIWFVWIIVGYSRDETMVHIHSGASSGIVEMQIFLALLFILPAIGYFSVITADFSRLYSDAENTIDQIHAIAGDELVVTADSRYAMSIAAADPSLKIEDMVHGCELGDLLFGEMKADGQISPKTTTPGTYTELMERMAIRGMTAPGDTWYLLTTENSTLDDITIWSTVMEKVYTTVAETISQESYCLYKVTAQ